MIPNPIPIKDDVVMWSCSGVVTQAIINNIDGHGLARVHLLIGGMPSMYTYDWDFVHSDSAADPYVDVRVVGI